VGEGRLAGVIVSLGRVCHELEIRVAGQLDRLTRSVVDDLGSYLTE
jgi:hypothetical protein